MSPLTLIADGQILFSVYFDLFSNDLIWFILVFQLVTALLPDIVLKVVENLSEVEFLRKEKQSTKTKITRASCDCLISRDSNSERQTFF